MSAVFLRQLRPAVASTLTLTLLTGCVFPLVLFVIARPLFPYQTQGSLLLRDRTVVGSRLIGQDFERPEWFQPRPSAAGNGYDGTASGGSNLGLSNPQLQSDIRRFAAHYRQENGLADDVPVPIDAVTRSASGLDPDISPANAFLQVPRIARERHLDEDVVRSLVAGHVRPRQLGFLGAPRVSVLELNLALDRLQQRLALPRSR
jgi:potassium-transporting ATPase KdpC subunit